MTGGQPSGTTQVAIVGAGPAGLAAAWGLTQPLPDGTAPNVKVTVYEKTWMAGGKCGSTRLDSTHRIVQNGTHYMFGVYFNTLKMVKLAHDQIQDPRFGGTDEFVGREMIVLKHFYQDEWHNWKFKVPKRGTFFPGDLDPSFADPKDYLKGVFEWLKEQLLADEILLPPGSDLRAWIESRDFGDLPGSDLDVVANAVSSPLTKILDLLITLAGEVADEVPGALVLLKKTVEFMRFTAQLLLGGITNIKVVHARILIDFVTTMVCGIIADDVLSGKIANLDAWDFADWLNHHGAKQETTESPLTMAWYDAVAAFENGDTGKPSFSAAAVLQTVIPAMLAYEGYFTYQMRPEAGECFIAPIFEALRQRNVEFRFLHELRAIVPDSAGNRIEKLIFDVPKLPDQPAGTAATLLESYDPLVEFLLSDGTKRICWPPEPKSPFEFAGKIDIQHPHAYRPCGPAREEVTREVDTHFDEVIFALPHMTVPKVASQLVAQKSEWKGLALLPAVETKSLRLWLITEFADLEWDADDPTVRPVLSGYEPLFRVWEDSGQQIPLHTWPDPPPKSIATLFGPLQARAIPFESQFLEWLYAWIQRYRARRQAREFLDNHVKGLWPGLANSSGDFKWNALLPVETPPDAFLEQWVVANSGASQRYTHAAPNTFQHRLRSGDTGYSNLSVAGEWTRFWPATANVELTVISGLRAAYDILGVNVEIPSEKGFFPDQP